jgi:shikimate dehydrogenase
MAKPPERTFCLLGHPVGHSLSPAIHEAAYVELGLLGCRYETVDCPDEDAVKAQIARLRKGELAGANVTVPWKRLALELADEVDPSAQATGAVNVLRPVGDGASRRLAAYNTDAPALAEELGRGRPGAPSARTAAVIGKGGAALAAVSACQLLGIRDVTVVARGWSGPAAAFAGADEFRRLGARPAAWAVEAGSAWHHAVTDADLVIQATSDGMHGASDGTSVRDVVPWAALRPEAFLYDVVYNPAVTPFVTAARAHGLAAESGLGMLVGQAALALELWTGKRPPLLPLLRAAEAVLAEKMRR